MTQRGRKGLSDQILEEIRPYLDEWVGSDVDFARVLHKHYPHRTHKSWTNSVHRFRKHHAFEIPDSTEDEIDASDEMLLPTPYYYNSTTDVYVVFLKSAGQNIVVSGDTHRAMRSAYSNMVGSGATMNEMAREFNFPRVWFREYRAVFGWTHDIDPYTDEEIMAQDTNELVEDLVLRRRRLLHRADEKKKWDSIRKDAEKWAVLEDTILEELRNLVQIAPKEPRKLNIGDNRQKFAIIISPTDFHWGKYGWEDEVGHSYSLEEAKERLVGKTEEIIDRLPANPEKIIVATGSDWFHIDNDVGTTTLGTKQDMSGSPAQILMSGCEMARQHIEMLRRIAPVEVVFMPGNHDKHSSLTLMMYLTAVYEGIEDVEVHNTPQSRFYLKYGNTLLGFTHGDKIRKNNLPALMATEKRVEWGQTIQHLWITGHLHHQELIEKDGAMIIQLPSLAGHDRWHYRRGYTMSRAGLSAHIIDFHDGLVGSLFSPVREH